MNLRVALEHVSQPFSVKMIGQIRVSLDTEQLIWSAVLRNATNRAPGQSRGAGRLTRGESSSTTGTLLRLSKGPAGAVASIIQAHRREVSIDSGEVRIPEWTCDREYTGMGRKEERERLERITDRRDCHNATSTSTPKSID